MPGVTVVRSEVRAVAASAGLMTDLAPPFADTSGGTAAG
jgi:hypothetical protein